MSKHTPGPWRVGADTYLGEQHQMVESEQEPVAWSVLDKRTKKHWYTNESKYTAQHYANECSHSQPDGSPSMVVTPLYTHPPRRVPEQEPVAVDDFFKMIANRNPSPFPMPQRQWVGLTTEEIKELWVVCRAALPRYICFARAIEAKLKEKNT